MSKAGEKIVQEMKSVRSGLADDVDELVDSAGEMLDLRQYIKSFPWAFLGGAVALGYLVVPRRLEIVSPDRDALLELAKQNKLVVQANPTPRKRGGAVGTLFGFAANALARGAVGYISRQAGKMMDDGGPASDQPPH